jgi:pimeloyl-ACP methyl ester carboxylesterase
MSTPPFINMPDGVGLFTPPESPVPVLVAEARTDGAGGADGTQAPARGSVLLVPGFTGSKEDFLAILEPLAAHGWRVAAMDLPGQGGAAPLGPRGSHTARTLADVVAAVAAWFAPEGRVHLLGHSMGGLITRELVLSDPRRLASWTAMSSGPASIPAHGHTALLQLEAALASAPIEVVWAMKEQLDRAGGWDPPNQEVADFCARRFITNDPAALSDCAEILMTAPDLTDQVAAALEASQLPAAVVTGEIDDAWSPAVQEQMAERLGVPWHTLPGLGHNPATEDPQLTATALNEVFGSAAQGRPEDPTAA